MWKVISQKTKVGRGRRADGRSNDTLIDRFHTSVHRTVCAICTYLSTYVPKRGCPAALEMDILHQQAPGRAGDPWESKLMIKKISRTRQGRC